MICNSAITIYHKGISNATNLETWTRYSYDNAWVFSKDGATINKGYDNADRIEIRLPYAKNELNINNFGIGDIIVKGKINTDISKQQDLKGYEIYSITSIKNNNFGLNKHIHIGGQ